MGQNLLLVGSVPLKTVEDVMRRFGGALGPYLPAIPDGEVGERKSWVLRLSYQVFNGHIDLETIKRPQRVNGIEQLMPRGRDDVWQFRVKEGVDKVRFGNPGYRLGYAKDAVNSYFVFKTLRKEGVLPADLRFQISMPMVNSVVRSLTFPTPGDLERIRPGYEEAIAAELDAILEAIPHRDLAIQWDLAWEVAAVYEGTRRLSGRTGNRNACRAGRQTIEEAAGGRRAWLSFLLRYVRRLAALCAEGSWPSCRIDQRGGCRERPTGRLGARPDARSHR